MMIKLNDPNQPAQPRQFQVRLPYAPPDGIGAGDVIARITQAMGIKPCQPCKARQEALNQRVRFEPW